MVQRMQAITELSGRINWPLVLVMGYGLGKLVMSSLRYMRAVVRLTQRSPKQQAV